MLPRVGGSTWKLWFIQLSGWPAFLTVVAITVLFMLLASIVLTWAGNRSIAQVAVIVVLAIAAILVTGLIGIAVLSRL